MPVIKLRGLPWSCTPEDIVKFLGDEVNIVTIKNEPETGDNSQQSQGQEGGNGDGGGEEMGNTTYSIVLTSNAEGRPSGEAFIELVDEADVETALRKNNAMMGQRYIEIFRSSIEQMRRFTAESNESAKHWRDPVVRLRGLPYGCTKKDVHDFFGDFSGRFNGEAFVQFSNMPDAHKALEKHKQKMGNRYLEIFRSTLEEMRHYAGDDGGGVGEYDDGNGFYNNGGGGGRMNGGKMMGNKRGMQMKSGGGRFNNGGGMDNRSRPYPNMRTGRMNSGGSGGGGGGGGGGFNSSFGGGGGGGGGLPSLMSNFNPNGAGFGGGGGGGMMENAFFNNPLAAPNFGGGGGGIRSFGGNNNQMMNFSNETRFCLKMRGLPFTCREDDIFEFFHPLKPINIEFLRGRDTRPSGECEVDFESEEELNEAMTYDKRFIGNRYIELFLVDGIGDGGSGGGGMKNRGGGGGGSRNSGGGKGGKGGKGGRQSGGGGGGGGGGGKLAAGPMQQSPGPNNPNNGIPSLFATQVPAAVPSGGPSMTTAYPHQQVAAAAFSNNVGDMFMADMAKKMFQNAFGQYPNNQMFNGPPQQHFGGGGGGGGGGKFNSRRY